MRVIVAVEVEAESLSDAMEVFEDAGLGFPRAAIPTADVEYPILRKAVRPGPTEAA